MTSGGPPPFGALLKRYRLAAALSQEALAERAGLSTRGISDLERGARRIPRPETAALLADALDLSGEDRVAFLAPLVGEMSPGTLAGDDGVPDLLPAPLTALLGREAERRLAVGLLRGAEGGTPARLVTLTGPGGVGKTRLALEVARDLADDFADGVRFVDLAPLRDPALVAATIADALGVHAEGQRPLREALIEHLRPRTLLLLLDNFEQVTAAAAFLATLLTTCPHLRALVTSRVALSLRGEREFPVLPLATPGPADLPHATGAGFPAVDLFVERARAVRPDFRLDGGNAATVAALCRRLDGLPLALELAAAQVRLLPPGGVLARLERRLPLPVAGPRDLPARQRTLHDTLAWSHDLLTPEQRALFRRLAVFSGGCELEAVQAVCGATPDAAPDDFAVLDDLLALEASSLLRAIADPELERTGGMRFGMLETVREYAAERLAEADEVGEVEARHAAHYLALASAAAALIGPDRASWFARLDRERDNVRAAWGAALGGGAFRAAGDGGGWVGCVSRVARPRRGGGGDFPPRRGGADHIGACRCGDPAGTGADLARRVPADARPVRRGRG